MEKGYLAVIEALGNTLISKDTEISLLKYEVKKLESKIESIEQHINFFENSCEIGNK